MREIDDNLISKDRMRYIKNKFSSNLCIIAILFDVFFFVSIYKINIDTSKNYYNILIGASIVYNLVFMLLAFLSCESVKNYDEKKCWMMVALGVLQIVRIFILPLKYHTSTVTIQSVQTAVMGSSQFMRCIIYLLISGACLLLGAVVGIKRSRTLKAYIATLGEEKRRD